MLYILAQEPEKECPRKPKRPDQRVQENGYNTAAATLDKHHATDMGQVGRC